MTARNIAATVLGLHSRKAPVWRSKCLRPGATDARVFVLDYLSPAQARGYLIVDNAFCEPASWDRKILRSVIEALMEMGADLELTGLTGIEIDSVLSWTNRLARWSLMTMTPSSCLTIPAR